MKQRTQQSNGAIAKNKKIRELSLANYYACPNFCAFCKKRIEISESDIPSQIKLKKYCNHKCYSADKIGRKIERYRRSSKELICNNCNENFAVKKRSLYRFEAKLFCDDCRHISKSSLYKLTKAELFAKNKNWQSARSSVGKHATSVFKRMKSPLLCFICGYSNHVEIAHIKSVSSFSDNTLISEINACSNLVALCPNHYWEFDNNYFSIPIFKNK